jgi:hypothetical protein
MGIVRSESSRLVAGSEPRPETLYGQPHRRLLERFRQRVGATEREMSHGVHHSSRQDPINLR